MKAKEISCVTPHAMLLLHACIKKLGNISGENHSLRENPYKPRQKSRLNSKKHTHVDDMMIHNLVKYLV